MNLDTASDKHIHEIERLARELLNAMRRAKYDDKALISALQDLETETSKLRRARYDAVNSEFNSY